MRRVTLFQGPRQFRHFCGFLRLPSQLCLPLRQYSHVHSTRTDKAAIEHLDGPPTVPDRRAALANEPIRF